MDAQHVVATVQTAKDVASNKLEYESARRRLKILEKIGKGSFAEVYKVLLDGTPAALKLAKSEKLRHDGQLSYFLKEGQVLQEYEHRNIVECYGVLRLPNNLLEELKGSSASGWGILQEYSERGSLSSLVGRQMTCPHRQLYTDEEALSWSVDIARALQYLHTRTPKVVHRDVKLDNVLLVPSEGHVVAKLCDLGLHVVLKQTTGSCNGRGKQSTPATRNVDTTQDANSTFSEKTCVPSASGSSDTLSPSSTLQRGKLLSEELPLEEHTVKASATSNFNHEVTFGSVSGTSSNTGKETFYNLTGLTGSYTHMAPEVYKCQPYNEKADVFSFGLILYELWTRTLLVYVYAGRRAPSSSVPGLQEFSQRLAAGFRPHLPKNVNSTIARLINSCWEEDPCLRPSMTTVLHTLERLDPVTLTLGPRCCTIC